MTTIDLNADLGEGMGNDDALLEVVSSASIACGGHAGDARTIFAALSACRQRGIRAGAHPGFADRANFGRLRLTIPTHAMRTQVQMQLLLIHTLATQVGVELAYLKLHGAMANMAAEDHDIAVAIFEAVRQIDPDIAILALDNSVQVTAASALGFPVIHEAYADRGYDAAGMLVARSEPGAVLHDIDAVVERCRRLAKNGEIVAVDGTVLRTTARSICLHGDTPGAVEMARAVRAALQAEGIGIAARPN